MAELLNVTAATKAATKTAVAAATADLVAQGITIAGVKAMADAASTAMINQLPTPPAGTQVTVRMFGHLSKDQTGVGVIGLGIGIVVELV